jgi:hypothetical protein
MVRYADGPTTEVAVHVNAAPEVVWTYVCDITVPVRFSRELQEVRWVGDRRFVGRNEHRAIGSWETTSTVVVEDPPREFAWAVEDVEHPSASWRFLLEPDGNGTLLRQVVRLGPGRSGLSPAIEARPDKEEAIVARRLEEHRANMQATVEGIKALAEGGH